jgi:FkbM family methyltransferase
MKVREGREQELVRAFFAGAQSGFFVEVGANRPQQESQTWHLERLGWTGLLIEPQPDLAEDLRRDRSAKVVAVACSSPRNAGRLMRLHVAGALSALDRDRMAPGAQPERIIEVPIRTLDDILSEAGAPTGFDFLSIDVEGHELEVLSGFAVMRWRPRLILLEDHVGSLAKHRFLKSAGYRLIRRFENNGWYVPSDTPVPIGLRERWDIVRKYYLGLPFRIARNASRALRRRLRERATG